MASESVYSDICLDPTYYNLSKPLGEQFIDHISVKDAVRATDEYFLFWKGWPSQWYPSGFSDSEGNYYNCCEQYMMAQKAKLFGDDEMFEAIMKSDCPREQKGMGRRVSGFDDKVWQANCETIVRQGNLLKFGQNERLQQLLLDTGELQMVEASPFDKIWGVGVSMKKAGDRSKWKGENKLGRILDVVRSDLRKAHE